MDPLLWKCYNHRISCRYFGIWSASFRRWNCQSYARSSYSLRLNLQFSLVYKNFYHSLPQQDWSIQGETTSQPDEELFPRLRRCVSMFALLPTNNLTWSETLTKLLQLIGASDYAAACDYILNRFVSLNQHDTKQIYTHFTCATDTTQIRFVMTAVNGK